MKKKKKEINPTNRIRHPYSNSNFSTPRPNPLAPTRACRKSPVMLKLTNRIRNFQRSWRIVSRSVDSVRTAKAPMDGRGCGGSLSSSSPRNETTRRRGGKEVNRGEEEDIRKVEAATSRKRIVKRFGKTVCAVSFIPSPPTISPTRRPAAASNPRSILPHSQKSSNPPPAHPSVVPRFPSLPSTCPYKIQSMR